MEWLAFRRASAVIDVAAAASRSDEPVDETHDVEGSPVHLVIGAEPEGRRDRHVGGSEGGDDLVLAAHVVRGGEHVAERRDGEARTRHRRRR